MRVNYNVMYKAPVCKQMPLLRQVLDDIDLPGYFCEIREYKFGGEKETIHTLSIGKAGARHSDAPWREAEFRTPPVLLSYIEEEGILVVVSLLVKVLDLHEMEENFRYKGRKILIPHAESTDRIRFADKVERRRKKWLPHKFRHPMLHLRTWWKGNKLFV